MKWEQIESTLNWYCTVTAMQNLTAKKPIIFEVTQKVKRWNRVISTFLARHEGLARMLRIRRSAPSVPAGLNRSLATAPPGLLPDTLAPLRVRVPLLICAQIKRVLLVKNSFYLARHEGLEPPTFAHKRAWNVQSLEFQRSWHENAWNVEFSIVYKL